MNSSLTSCSNQPAVIFLIEGDIGIRSALCEVLMLRGHKVIRERELVECVTCLRKQNADCVIVDYDNLPLDGANTAIELICEVAPHIPFILLTNHKDEIGTLKDCKQISLFPLPLNLEDILTALSSFSPIK